MPALNRIVKLRPTSVAVAASNGGLWSSVTSPEATVSNNPALMLKGLTARAGTAGDGGDWTWGDAGNIPQPGFGLIRPGGMNFLDTVQIQMFMPDLRADPNEYITKYTIQWYGGVNHDIASGRVATPTIKAVMRAAGGGATIAGGDFAISAADVLDLKTNYNNRYLQHVIVPPGPAATTRAKGMYLFFQQIADTSGGSTPGFNLYRVQVLVELSLVNRSRIVV